jgi:hypothetical protein
VPSVAGCEGGRVRQLVVNGKDECWDIPSSKALPSSRICARQCQLAMALCSFMCGLAHLATALARVDGILALHGRLEAWRLHGFLTCAEEYGRSVVGGAVLRSSGASRRASHGHPEAEAQTVGRVDERSRVGVVRCRVRAVDLGWQTPPRGQ